MSTTNKSLSPFWTLFILSGLNLLNYLDRYVLSGGSPSLQPDLGIDDGDAGRIVTAFMIHLFGDIWSPEIVGRLSVAWGSLRQAVLILPGALLVGAVLWLCLAVRTLRNQRKQPGQHAHAIV